MKFLYFIVLDLPIIGRSAQQHDANNCGPVAVPPPLRDGGMDWEIC